MTALFIGILCIGFAIVACIPGLLGWWQDVLAFLRGSIPVLAALVGIIAIFIAVADIKDRIEAKKEEKEDAEAEKKD